MTDYSELIKALRETDSSDWKRLSLDAAAAIEALQAEQNKTVTQIFGEEKAAWEGRCKDLMYIIADLQDKVPHWVSVEDSMPDLLQFVLVCNDEGKCVVAQYVGYQTDSLTAWRIAYTMYDTDIYDEKECGPVCYWMPIEPPQEVQDVKSNG